MMRHLLFQLPLLLASTALAAACPVAKDLGDGIRLTQTPAYTAVFRRDPSGAVIESESAEGGGSYNYVMYNGLLETAFFELDPSQKAPRGRDRFHYSFALEDVFPLEPWTGQTGIQTHYDADWTLIAQSNFGYRVLAADQLEIGDCTYDRLPVETYIVGADGARMVTFGYLPDLGLSVLMGYQESDGSRTTFEPVSIAAIE